jgi:hypothetical protein
VELADLRSLALGVDRDSIIYALLCFQVDFIPFDAADCEVHVSVLNGNAVSVKFLVPTSIDRSLVVQDKGTYDMCLEIESVLQNHAAGSSQSGFIIIYVRPVIQFTA